MNEISLQYLHQNFNCDRVIQEIAGTNIKDNGGLEHENPKDFSRVWSVSIFTFLVPDYIPKEEENIIL